MLKKRQKPQIQLATLKMTLKDGSGQQGEELVNAYVNRCNNERNGRR